MLILTIKTNEPLAEVGLFADENQKERLEWEGHKQLSVTIHRKIEELLGAQGKKIQDINGVGFYAGPGSFTGLRIGAAVASTIAYGLKVPVVSTKGQGWEFQTLTRLKAGVDEKTAKPFYGKRPHTTKPRK